MNRLCVKSDTLTLGQLCERLRREGVEASQHQVKYALDAYHIEPLGRVGILRVWGEDAVPRLRSALVRIAERRGGRW